MIVLPTSSFKEPNLILKGPLGRYLTTAPSTQSTESHMKPNQSIQAHSDKARQIVHRHADQRGAARLKY